MIFLLDTNVISELRRLKPHGALLAWYNHYPQTAYAIPTIALFEMQAGAEITRQQDRLKASEIDEWIQAISETAQSIPLDVPSAREAARLMHGSSPHLMEDAMIAATAAVHNLTIATRNTKDFNSFGVRQVNPFLFRKS